MVASRIATTSARDLQPLGTGGQLVIATAPTLLALLARELSPAHAALFAEPQPNSARGEVDWYAEGSGPALPLDQLPPDQRATIEARLDRLSDDIRALAGRLRQAPDESERFLAAMLDLALRLPGPDAIRARNGQPVLVGWGHAPAGPVSGEVPVLGRLLHVPPPMAIRPPPVLPQPAGPRRWPWLIALAAACLLLIGVLRLPPPATASPAACRLADGDLAALDGWRNADARNATLRTQLAALVDGAGARRLRCPPVAPPVTPAAAPGGDAGRAQLRGGHSGKLQIILAWDDRNDLDLHIVCPGHEHLFYHNRTGCGGELDVDANADADTATTTPVENAVWANPPPGTYRVVVDPYDLRNGTSTTFRVTVRQEGQPDRVQQGTAVAGQRYMPVLEFQVPPP
jgi:hypothetical protein